MFKTGRILDKSTGEIFLGQIDKELELLQEYGLVEIPNDGKEYETHDKYPYYKPKQKDLTVELDKILYRIREAHLQYLQTPIEIVQGYSFVITDEYLNQFDRDIKNAVSLGFQYAPSRDYYNRFFNFNIQNAGNLYLQMWLMQKLSFFKKWLLEKPFKKCTTIEQLEKLPLDFKIEITPQEVQMLIQMDTQQRNEYINDMFLQINS